MNLMNTIMHLLPDAKCVTYGEDHTKTIWLDERPMPTQAQLEAAQPALQAKDLQQEVNNTALAYLAETDWYVLRQVDDGTAMPLDIKTARADARLNIVGELV